MFPILAQLSRAHKIYGRPEEESPIGTVVLLVILVILLLVLAFRIGKRFFVMVKQPGPADALFFELAEAHALSADEQKVLKRLARRENLANPVQVFVEKGRLEAYAKSSTNRVYQRLYEKLFST